MRLCELLVLLGCDVLWGEDLLEDMDVNACFAADLMSDVLRFSEPGALLITGLTSVQSIHTADVADLRAILFVGSKRPGAEVTSLARERGIPILSTERSMFDACAILKEAGLEGGPIR